MHQGEGLEKRGGERAGPEKGRDKPQLTVAEPQPIWGMLYADDVGICFQIEEEPCEDVGKYHCSVRFVRIDSLGSQDGGHLPDNVT